MKFIVALMCLIVAAFAAPAEKDLKGSEQVYVAAPYAYSAYSAAAVPAVAAAAYPYAATYPYAASAYSYGAYPYAYYYR
ncbi:uncharacterized protein LOC135941121 [Cloeon dipterum]|uniref:Uncharacterized protein n=1 Tax=Cloeon dipterum TaxID=197152 RepID=A0A8S1C8C8_9INSE|nr:Hypothetical predicted protein [Cloeon dipterum]